MQVARQITDVVFARLEKPDAAGLHASRRARECLFRHVLYPVEALRYGKCMYGLHDTTDVEDKETVANDAEIQKWVSLKNVKYWWPIGMFTFFGEDGTTYDPDVIFKIE